MNPHVLTKKQDIQGDNSILTNISLSTSSLATLSIWRGAGGEAGLGGIFINR